MTTATAAPETRPAHSKPPAGSSSAVEEFARRFADDSQWEHVRGVPCFDEHTENYSLPSPDGQPQTVTETFDVPRLQRIADNCNRLVASGNPIGLSEGHTLDKAPESQQPQTLGWGHNYRVGFHPQLGRHVIYQDEKYPRDKYEHVKTFPFRSVERWRPNAENGGDYFKPVALLRREPRRPLGPVVYQREGHLVVRYSMEYAMPQPPAPPAAGSPPAPPAAGASPAGAPPAAGAPIAPIEDPAAREPSAKDKAIYEKLCYAHPHLGRLMKYMEANPHWPGPNEAPPSPAPVPGAQGAPPAPPSKNGMGMGAPSGTNTFTPHLQKGPEQMAADTATLERYQAEIEALKEARDQDAAELARLAKGERLARYAYRIKKLVDQGYPIVLEEEVTRCQDWDQERFNEHYGDGQGKQGFVEKYGANSIRPSPGDPLQLHRDNRPVGMPGSEADRRMTEDECKKALAYQDEHPGVSWPAALKYAMTGEVPVRG